MRIGRNPVTAGRKHLAGLCREGGRGPLALGRTPPAPTDAAAVRILAPATLLLAAMLFLAPAAAAHPPPFFGHAPPAPSPADDRPAGVPSDEELERAGAVIGAIVIYVEDIFNPALPEENNRLFRLANRLHIDTRGKVIRRQLLFDSGQPYSAQVLRETERLMRTRKYLFDCWIRPTRYADNRVDLEVRVRDVWTLDVGFSVNRSGGASERRFELADQNIFGSGKTVEIEAEDTVDRTSLTARFLDENLFGRWVRLAAIYADSSDGERTDIDLSRPFYALDTRWAAGIRVIDDQRIDRLYELGEVRESFLHRQEQIEVFGGLSRGLERSRTRRWLGGVTYQLERFADAPDTGPAPGRPSDRKHVYPWVGFESVPNAFTTTRNQDQLGRTEDVPLGTRYRLRLGFASTSLGSDRDRAVFRASTEFGVQPAPALRLLGSAAVTGSWRGDGFDDLLARVETRCYRRTRGGHLFFAQMELAAARDLYGQFLPREHRVNTERRQPVQLLLGGDSGLRGYPLRYQDGEGRALLTLEQRFFTGLYPLRLAFVGAAVFFDIGRTWPGDSGSANLGWLSDVGFGLRLSSSRSGFGSVIHFDVAFPLDRQGSIDSIQWLVTSKQSL